MLIECEVVKQDCSKTVYVNGCGYNHEYLARAIINTDAIDILGAEKVRSPITGILYLCHHRGDPHIYPLILKEATWERVVKAITTGVVEI